MKAFLLDQKRIAGVGNIYADEALFRARVHPLREAGRLTRAQWALLRDTVREALQEGIDANGATIDDFRDLDGARGSFQDRFLVHRRAGEPCPRCGGPVRKLLAAGRGTYVCERCQPRPRGARDRADEPLSAGLRARAPRCARSASSIACSKRVGPQRRVALQRLVLRPLLARSWRACAAPCRRTAARASASNQPSSATSRPPWSSPKSTYGP